MNLNCPECQENLNEDFTCRNGHSFEMKDGVLELLSQEFGETLHPWLEDYQKFQTYDLPEIAFNGLPESGVPFNTNIWSARQEDCKIIKTEILSSHKFVLDIGGWNGWLANVLSKENLKVTSIDYFIHPMNGLRAKKFYRNPVWDAIQMNLEDLSVFTTKFDIIILNRCIAYFEDFEKTIAQCKSIVAPKGKIFISGINVIPGNVTNELTQKKKEFKEQMNQNIFFKKTKAYFDDADCEKLKAVGFSVNPYPNLRNRIKTFLKIGSRSYYAIYQNKE